MRGRPAQTLTRAEEAELRRVHRQMEKAEERFAEARAALAAAARRIGKPEAVARALGVTRGTIDYWIRTQGT